GTHSAGFYLSGGASSASGSILHPARIYMDDSLVIRVDATLSGSADIRSKNVKINAGEMLLQALRDVSASESWQANIGVGKTLDAAEFLGNIGGSNGSSSKNWIRDLSKIIGTEAVEIVVARTLT